MVDDLASRLKQLRQEKHLRQVQLAALIGVEKSTISNYEMGTRQPPYSTLIRLANLFNPPYSTLIRLANLFNVSTDYLLGRTNERLLDLSGLTAEEAAMVTQLVASMAAKNKRLEEYL